MSKSILISATLLGLAAFSFAGNPKSPDAKAEAEIGGKKITITYSAPSMRGRKIFGTGGQISKDPTWPVWRTGADSATSLHTEGTLKFHGLDVPPGDYTVFTLVNVMPWQLIINKQTKQWGLTYKPDMDLGRVPMNVTTAPAPIELMKISLMDTGGNEGKLQIEWENTIATVPFSVK